ncbi:MAG TPA: ABC transporter permease [Gemmatimonadaceae bacterium]|nr:ABC transporter permease [Gemmatimonadaceae bacterium]
MRFEIRPGVRRLFRLPLRSRAQIRAELDEELDALIASRVDDLVARGMSTDDAYREALRRLGAPPADARRRLRASAEHREQRMRINDVADNLAQDLRYAFRGLRAKPGFTAAVVTTLALGIGANAAIFGIVDRMLFRPPPMLRDPATAHQVYVSVTYRGQELVSNPDQYARYLDLTRDTRSFATTAAYARRDIAVGVGDAAREMSVGAVSSSFFDFFDARPEIGRFFSRVDDAVPAGQPVAVLSHTYWQTAFGQRADAIGSKIQIGPTLYTIIGVAPDGFAGLWPAKPPVAYIPITNFGSARAATAGPLKRQWWTTYSWGWMSVMARRKPGISIAQANADLTHAMRLSYLAEAKEQGDAPPIDLARPRAMVASILDERGPNASSVSKVVLWVGGVSLVVLLIACANVANLLLARAFARRREIAVRLALGISRSRLLGQLLTESLVLALLGGVAGLIVGQWGGGVLRGVLIPGAAPADPLRDSRTILFAAAAMIGVGVLTGLAPIMQAARGGLTLVDDLRSGVREGTYHRSRLRAALLVAQGALSVVLLVGAGLFVRSLMNVKGQRLGYDVDPVAIVELNMRGLTLDSARTYQLVHRLLSAAKAVPGVTHATLSTSTPFYSLTSVNLTVPGIDSVRRLGRFQLDAVSPEYFATYGTRILRGRGITDADMRTAPKVMVVSDGMAKRLWPGRDAMGQCVRVQRDSTCTTVVGISEDVHYRNIGGDSATFSYYLSAEQYAQRPGLAVRTAGPASHFVEPIRRALQHEMPGARYVTVTPFSTIVGRKTQSWELGATMFAVYGLLALALAAVGLYSVVAYNVAQRTHEMGVRIALGARVRDVVLLVLRDGFALGAAGLAIGAVIALGAARWIAPLLFKESARDPIVFGGAALVLLAATVAASWIPALRAARVDPQVALRAE